MEFKKHCKVVFGLYAEAHDDAKEKTKGKPRNDECIALVPTKNLQGTQKVICINMVRVTNIGNTTPIVAPD